MMGTNRTRQVIHSTRKNMDDARHQKIERSLQRLARRQVKQLSEHKGPLVEKLKVKAALAETREVLRLHRLNRFKNE